MIIKSKVRTRETRKCFILDGQSNMEGGDDTGSIDSQYSSIISNSLVAINRGNNLTTANFAMEPLQFSVNNDWRNRTTYCGPELAFAKDYTDSTGEKIVIIKYSLGGSLMVDDGTVQSNGHWQWNATHNAPSTSGLTSGRNHYEILRDLYIIEAIVRFRSIGIELDFCARITDQGEGDMQTEYRANNWGQIYKESFNKLIEQILPYNSSIANMKPVLFHTGGPNYSNIANRPYYSTVRQQQTDIMADMDGILISKNNFSAGTDGVHETRTTQCLKGSLLATTLYTNL